MIHSLNIIKRVVDSILSYAVILVSSSLVICVVWQVFSRYALGKPSVFTDEIARFAFMWVGLIGAAYAAGLKRHLALDLLSQKLTGNKKLMSEVVIILMSMVFAGVIMVYGGWALVNATLASKQISPVLGIRMGLVYVAIPVSGIAILFYSFVDLMNKLFGNSSTNQEVNQ